MLGRVWAEVTLNSTRSQKRSSRRYLTAVFSDLSHSTRLAGDSDPEAFAALLDRLGLLFEEVIARRGGTILQIRGDGVFAAFGLNPQEDAARQAATAAVELHARARQLPRDGLPAHAEALTLHTGIHSSYVVAIEGDQVSGKYTLVGEAGNLAAKLSDAAGPDEILMTDSSLATYQRFFALGAPRSLLLGELEQPFPVQHITGLAAAGRADAGAERAPLIGRGTPMSILQAAQAACEGECSQIVAVTGPAGIGKTRLTEEFLAPLAAGPCRVLRSYCEAGQNAEPLQPILQILREVLGPPDTEQGRAPDFAQPLERLAPGLATHAETVKHLLYPQPGQAHPGERHLFRAFTDLLNALAIEQPLVILIDDWHWADDLTLATIDYAARQVTQRLLLLQCSRDAMTRGQADEIIELAPLARTDAAALIDALTPTPDAEQIQAVLEASGGNPLFIEELCHAIRRRDASPASPHWQSAPVPTPLAELIASRINRLEPAQLALLQKLSVIGNVVPQWLLAAATAGENVEPLVRELAALDLVYGGHDGQSLRFKHGVTRDVVLDSLSREARSALHASVAVIIEARYPGTDRGAILETLAYHYAQTEQHTLAADYAEAAGDKAMAAGVTDRVRLQYQAALRALDRIGDQDIYERWVAIAKRLALACLFDAEPSQCDIYRQLIRRAVLRGDTANELDGEYWLAYVNYALGNAPEAIKHVDRAQFLAKHIGSPAIQTQVLSTWGQARALACDYESALPAMDDALRQQEPYRRKPGVAFAYAYSLACKSMVLGDRGQFAEAFECLDEAEILTDGPVHPVHGSIVSMKTAVLIWQGNWEGAELAARSNIEIGKRTGSRYITAAGTALQSYARWQQDPDADFDEIGRALAWIERHHQTIWTSLHFSWYCEMLVKRKAYEAARRAAVWVLQRARKRELLGESVAYSALAEIPGPNAPETARRCFARALRSAEKRQSPREQTLVKFRQAVHFQASGPAEETDRILSDCETRFSELGMYAHAARAQQSRNALTASAVRSPDRTAPPRPPAPAEERR